jgi:hypothetical protein
MGGVSPFNNLPPSLLQQTQALSPAQLPAHEGI